MVSNLAIVGNMHVGHNQAMRSNDRFPFVFGGSVDGDAFAYFGVITNFNGGFFSFEFKILRDYADYGTGKNFNVLSNGCTWV